MSDEHDRDRLAAAIASAKLDQGRLTLAELLIIVAEIEKEGGDSAPLRAKAKTHENRMDHWRHARNDYVERAAEAVRASRNQDYPVEND